jgi:ribosomal protein S27E
MKTLTTTKKKRRRFTLIQCPKCGHINRVFSLLLHPVNKDKYCNNCETLLF